MTGSLVLKFGGAALCDGAAVRAAVKIVQDRGGERPIVVVSAHQGVTAQLRAAALDASCGTLAWDAVRVRHRTILRQLGLEGELLDRHLLELRAILEEIERAGALDRSRLDFVLSFGERMSARIFAAVLKREGTPALPLDAYDLELVSEGLGGRGLVARRGTERVREELLALGAVPVITGFLALDRAGKLTTLGRSGSDLTAVWLGEAVGAREVQLWKSVPGLLTADPSLVSAARPILTIGWDEAAELAGHGAEVLHKLAVEPARRAGLSVTLRNVNAPDAPGTKLVDVTTQAGPIALAQRANVALYRTPLAEARDAAGALAAIAAPLEELGLEPYALAAGGTECMALLPDGKAEASVLDRLAQRGSLERGWSTIALVGRGVGADEEVAARSLAAAAEAGIALSRAPLGSSPRALLFLVRRESLRRALGALHAAWFGERCPAAPRASEALA